MTDDFERLMAEDAAVLRAETERALGSGLERRMVTGLRTSAAPGWRWKTITALAAVMAMVIVIAVERDAAKKPVVGERVVAGTVAAGEFSSREGPRLVPSTSVPIPRVAGVKGVRGPGRRRVAKAHVFPSPAPLNAEERELALLARLEPQELGRLYKDQQSMRADFERGNQEFAARVAAQEEGAQDDH